MNNRGYLSFSQLQLAAKCGEAYRRRYMNDEEFSFRLNVPALCGSAFHEAVVDFELLMEGLEDPGWEHMVPKLTSITKEKVREELDRTEIATEDLIFYGRQDLPFWYKNKIPMVAQSYISQRIQEIENLDFAWGVNGDAKSSLEVECNLEIAGYPFVGMIDQVFVDSKGRVVIRDLKTGKPSVGHAMQLEQYRLALKMQHGIDAAYGQLLYLNKAEPHMQVVKWSLCDEDVIDLTARLVKSISSDQFLVNGPFTGACDLCDFRPECRFGQVDVHGIA